MKITGIEKAVRDYNEFNGARAIYLNFKTKKVYADEINTPLNFLDNSDIELISKFLVNEHGTTTTVKFIKERATTMIEGIEKIVAKKY